MKKRITLFLFFICCCIVTITAARYEVKSPDGKLKIIVTVDNGTQYEIYYENTRIINPSSIGLSLNDGTVIGKGTVNDTEARSVNGSVEVLFGKNTTIPENYRELIIHYTGNYDLTVRAYNEGMAYRWVTDLSGEIIINNEDFTFNFAEDPTVYFPEATQIAVKWDNHWEKKYTIGKASSFNSIRYAIAPTLFSWPDRSYKIVIAESDVYDYPGLYIQATGSTMMTGKWANYPKTVEDPDNIFSNHDPLTRYDYIVRTGGSRTFPWRVFAVSGSDRDLLNNELVYLLAEPNRLASTDWITPGKSTWEWWHKAMLTPDGKADPANGIPANGSGNEDPNRGELLPNNLNFDLYKYYVDFAVENGIEYLTVDAGHKLGNSGIRRLCSYADLKGVKIILWTWASQALEDVVNGQTWLQRMQAMGVSGVKIDFFNRSDQIAMTWGRRLAQELADLNMVAIYHGCPVPTGLNRTYPNILNFEAVLGNEENFWRRGSDPDYHVQYPFIRQIAGPVDYTPGSLRNKNKVQFQPVDLPNVVPSSQGTRAHELAMYIVFDQWLGYLCDAPTEYRKFPDILDFLSNVPAVWDKTVPLDSKLGEYITIAKQSGTDWYVGGMSNWTAHDVEVDFSFLLPGKDYIAYILKDGNNANNYPTRYTADTMVVNNQTSMLFNMAQGGGFVIRLQDKEGTGLEEEVIEEKTKMSVTVQQDVLSVQSNEPVRRITLYTPAGQVVIDRTFPDHSFLQEINLSACSKGIYIAQIRTDSSVESLKFIY